jgi:hypothetical protein
MRMVFTEKLIRFKQQYAGGKVDLRTPPQLHYIKPPLKKKREPGNHWFYLLAG